MQSKAWDHLSKAWDHLSKAWDHLSKSWDHLSKAWDHLSKAWDHLSKAWDHLSKAWQGCIQKFGEFVVWKKEGGRKLCACEARHLGGSGGMLPREIFVIFSALSFNLVQTEGKYAVGKKFLKCKGAPAPP